MHSKAKRKSSLERYEAPRKRATIKLPSHKLPSLASLTTKRLRNELEEITADPPAMVSARLKADHLHEWTATIQGPPGSCYEGGTFQLDISIPKGYPCRPPKVTFATRVYHCNINRQGWVSMDRLHQDWTPALTVSKILVSVQSLLTDPNPDDPLVPEVAKLYVSDRAEHDRICREWTRKYASS